MEILDLYDNNFNKLDKTIIRRVDEIPNNTNIMLSYAIIKNDNKYFNVKGDLKEVNSQWLIIWNNYKIKEIKNG